MKFKTTIATPQASIERPSTSNNNNKNVDDVATAAQRRQRYISSDYTTEVSLYNSKSDSWGLTLNDETTQTGNTSGSNSIQNVPYTDAERQQQRQYNESQDDETTDLLSSSSKQRSTTNLQQPSPLKPVTSNLTNARENPWKKLSNVRYKPEGRDDNQRHYQHVQAQHITFV